MIENKDRLFDENVLHFTNHGTASRYDISMKIKELFNSNSVVEPVESGYFSSTVKRPPREYMSMERTMKMFPDFSYRSWEESLSDYISTYETNPQ